MLCETGNYAPIHRVVLVSHWMTLCCNIVGNREYFVSNNGSEDHPAN
jgi:hypothetical protein